ncbi:MAG: MFS transporter [Patescibacteria group bacterium]
MNHNEEKKTVRVFSLTAFLHDVGSDMVFPFWPFFVTSVLGASASVLGFLDGLGDALVSISQAASGYLSDKTRKRKVFIWLGYLFGAAARVGYAFSFIWQHLVPFRILDRSGKIRGAPRDAVLADVSTDANRGKNFGFLHAMDNLGAVCGILLALFLVRFLDLRTIFLIAAIPSLLGVLLIIFAIKEAPQSERKIFKGLSLAHLTPAFKLFLSLSAIFSLGSFSYSFLLLYVKELGFPIVSMPLFYLLFTAVAAVAALPFGKLSDRWGRKNIALIGFGFWGLASLTLLLGVPWAAFVALALYGLHKGALEPVQRTFVAELAPTEYRASALGGFQMVMGLLAFPSSFLAGVLWEKVSPAAPFALSLVLTLIAMVLLLFVRERRETKI